MDRPDASTPTRDVRRDRGGRAGQVRPYSGKMATEFTAGHRGGSGSPLVCLHGFMDTWRSWELVLPALERRHEVYAPTLPGHAGGPPLPEPLTTTAVVDQVEGMLDEAGVATAHLVGNSLGGYLALLLAERGRARSVVALAPGGGWAEDDPSFRELLSLQGDVLASARAALPALDAALATRAGRRRATELVTVRSDHLTAGLVAHLVRGVAASEGAPALIDNALREGWSLDPERIACPVRVLWGTADRLLPWPRAAERYWTTWLPHADWVVLDDVGHCPQLDVPLETAELILGWTGG